MAGVLNLGDVLELVDNRLHQCSFTQQHLVAQRHEVVVHGAPEFGDELQVLVEPCLSAWEM